MARRSNTSTSSSRSNESGPVSDNAGDPAATAGLAAAQGAGETEDASGGPGAEGSDISGAEGSGVVAVGANAGAAADAAPPARTRKKRGPNKPKPGTFTVETKAVLKQDQIFNLLTAHAAAQLGSDVASRMMLQVIVEGACRPLEDVLPQGATLQFATVQTGE